MPKTKRTPIGYVRPKKRPISQDQELPEEPTNTTESEDIPEEAVPMQPEAGLSAMPITDGGSNDVPPQEPQPELSKLQQLRRDMAVAEKEYVKVQRKWNRKAKTHFSGKYSPWSEPSVVARVKARLQQADDELDAARVKYHERRRRYMAHRTEKAMWAQPKMTEGFNMLKASIIMRANGWDLRDLDARINDGHLKRHARLKGVFELNNEGPGAVDLVAKHLGLAQAWGLMNASEL